MPDLSVSYSDIQKNVALMLGWNRTPSDEVGTWSANQISDFDLVMASGLRKFYGAYDWSFMKPRYTLTTSAAYSTGTVTISSGTVLGDGTDFPDESTDYWLNVSGKRYEVTSRTGDTGLTLTDTSINIATDSAYSLTRYKYTLPADFGGFIGPLTYAPNQSDYYRPVEMVDDYTIRTLYMTNVLDNASEIVKAAVVPQAFTATVGQRWELHTWPSSTSKMQLTGNYRVVPNDLDAGNLYPLGGAQHGNTILYAVLSEAETRLWDNISVAYGSRFRECLQMSIAYDRRQGAPETLGVMQFPGSSGLSVRGSLAQEIALYEGHESSIV